MPRWGTLSAAPGFAWLRGEGAAMADDDQSRQPTYPADKARQGDIVLRSRASRAIFIIGLAGAAILAALAALWPHH
jgi:hypothetical protein